MRPRRTSLRRRGASAVGRVFIAVVLALGHAGCATPVITPPTMVTPEPPDQLAAALVELTNDVRQAEGLPALESSSCATERAAERAEALRGLDLEHAPLDDVFAECGVDVAGENLSRGAVPASAVVDAWSESPGHRANLINPDYRAIGVACVPDGDEVVCAQIFLGE